MRVFRLLSNGIEKVESLLVSLALLFMIGLAFLQVLLRNFWDTGITWGDPIVRALVLWVGFLGASIATHQRGHIKFDVVSKFLPHRTKKFAEFVVHWASAFVCVLLANAAYEFMMMEKEFQSTLVEGVPTWIALTIIPVSFLIMAFRFFLNGLDDLVAVFKTKQEGA